MKSVQLLALLSIVTFYVPFGIWCYPKIAGYNKPFTSTFINITSDLPDWHNVVSPCAVVLDDLAQFHQTVQTAVGPCIDIVSRSDGICSDGKFHTVGLETFASGGQSLAAYVLRGNFSLMLMVIEFCNIIFLVDGNHVYPSEQAGKEMWECIDSFFLYGGAAGLFVVLPVLVLLAWTVKAVWKLGKGAWCPICR